MEAYSRVYPVSTLQEAQSPQLLDSSVSNGLDSSLQRGAYALIPMALYLGEFGDYLCLYMYLP